MIRSLRLVFCALALLVGGVGLAFAAAPTSGGGVLIVPISGTVDEGMAHLVQRAVREAESAHASALVLDINTPGGLVSAASRISNEIGRAHV